METFRSAIAASGLSITLVAWAAADVVELEGGGRLRGETLREGDAPRSELTVRTPWGPIVVERNRVERLTVETPADVEYRRRAPTVSDTVAAQHALALWCRDHGLGDAMRVHLGRVLELDSNHEASRRLLGYQRVDGEWLRRDDVLARRGLVRHEGQYRTRQEIALLERREKVEAEVRALRRRLADLRERLLSADRDVARTAAEELATLDDPLVEGPLAEWLLDERDPVVRTLLVQTAGDLDRPATIRALARLAIEDPDAERRLSAVEQLARSNKQGLAAPFVAALASKDNAAVNRAGDALTVLGGPGVLGPLIDALVTTHRFRVGADTGGDAYSLNAASGQFTFGGGGPRVVKQQARNPRVLAALVERTGMNFSFDEERWRAWLATQQVAAPIDLRRDP